MSKKLIVFDIDGTLYDHATDVVPESTYKALEKLRNNPDYTLAIATGRSSYKTQKVNHLFKYFDAFIFLNGLHIEMDGEEIYRYYPPKEKVDEVIHSLESLGRIYGCFTKEQEYISSIDESILEAFDLVSQPAPPVGNVRELEGIQQIYFFGDQDHIKHLEEEHPEFRVMSWYSHGADIVPMIADKSHGIRVLMDHFGHNQEHVVAFGDASNDIGMLSFAGIGVAMGDAIDELKNVADFVTKPVYDDGIIHALEELGLIDKE